MNHRYILAAATLVLGPLAPMAASAADLIGDTLVFSRAYPTPTTPYTTWNPVQVSTTVSADASDLISWSGSSAPITIDPGANQIVFTFLSSTSYIGAGNIFDGFVITGFSHDIVSADIASETLPGSVSLTVAPRQLNLSINSGTGIGQTITLSVSVVPEPGAWALLLGGVGALGALAWHRRAR